MSKTSDSNKVRRWALEFLKNEQGGATYSNLMHNAASKFPEVNPKSIPSYLWDLDKRFPEEIYKPERGIFRNRKFMTTSDEVLNADKSESALNTELSYSVPRIQESDFYQSFADWLINATEECTRAIPLGGSKFGDKWGTPDVIGVREAQRSDIIKFTTEILSAEIKLNNRELITAFGQACAYRIFSHKVYLVIPRVSMEEDKSRLDALSRLFGIGLVLFNGENPENPEFEIKVRPQRFDPDMYYSNKYLKMIERDLFGGTR
jgi:hypothetical protein